jgi:hypothetical protein
VCALSALLFCSWPSAFLGLRPASFVGFVTTRIPRQSPFDNFDLLVFDSDHHPELPPISTRGKKLIGYLSVGEVEDTRNHFASVKADGFLLEENRNWKGSFFVDVRDSRWTKRIIEELIPEMLRRRLKSS